MGFWLKQDCVNVLLTDGTHDITGNAVLDGIAQHDAMLRNEAAQRFNDGTNKRRRFGRFLTKTKRTWDTEQFIATVPLNFGKIMLNHIPSTSLLVRR